MKQLAYFAMTQQQFEQIAQQLDLFDKDSSKRKNLYEVQYTVFDIDAFERPSNPSMLCVHRRVLDKLIDPSLAYQVIKHAFGQKIVEFVPSAQRGRE